jgi:hypothetical protein
MGKSQGISTITTYAMFTRFSAFACTRPELALPMLSQFRRRGHADGDALLQGRLTFLPSCNWIHWSSSAATGHRDIGTTVSHAFNALILMMIGAFGMRAHSKTGCPQRRCPT